MDDYTGKRLDGRYEIQEVMGVGGMAVVYKAYDNIDDRIVAVKILKDEFLANEEFRRRFKNESKAIAVLSHPNIVKVYDVSYGDRLQYIVMEYVEGITLKEYIQQQGIIEGIKNGASYRFSAQSDNFVSDEDIAKEMERFNKLTFQNLKTNGGTILFPAEYKDVKQLKQEAYKVDADQMKLIKENVYDYFAVNEDVIQNKAFGDNWLACYEGAVEWFAIQLSEVLTRMLYTERERQRGNRIWFTSNRLQYMSNADKMNAISQMADQGLMTRNELREILNLSPLPEPYGNQIPARGEYYDITNPPDDKQSDNDGGDPDASED